MGVAGESHLPIKQISPFGQEFPQEPQCLGWVSKSKQPSGQFVRPAVQRAAQLPFWQNFPAVQEFPQDPQLLLSVIGSIQVLLHASRSEEQKTDFVTGTVVGMVVRTVVGTSVAGILSCPVVGNDVGTSVLTTTDTSLEALPDPFTRVIVDTGVTGVPAETDDPLPVSRDEPMKRMIRIMMTSPATATRPFTDLMPDNAGREMTGPGCVDRGEAGSCESVRSGLRDAPQFVQNFSPVSTALPHRGQNRRQIT